MEKRALIWCATEDVISVTSRGRMQLPGIGSVSPATPGWRDHGYEIVPVSAFLPPPGMRRVGAPHYSYDGRAAIEHYAVEAIPLRTPEVTGRWRVTAGAAVYWVDWTGEAQPTTDDVLAQVRAEHPEVDQQEVMTVEEVKGPHDGEPSSRPYPGTPRWSLKSLLKRASEPDAPATTEPPPAARVRMPQGMAEGTPPAHGEDQDARTDEERRATARDMIMSAVAAATNYAEHQVRYELALMARNGNAGAVAGFEREARTRSLTVEQLVDLILVERRTFERRTLHIHAVQAQVLAAIDNALGPAIDVLAVDALTSINERADHARP